MLCAMKSYTSLLLLLFSSPLLLQSSGHPDDIVSDVCHKIAAVDPNANYAVCIEALASAPAGRRSDLKGLALTAAKLTKTNATNMRARIKRMLKSMAAETPYMRSCLKTCLQLYSDSAAALRDSAVAVRDGRYVDASTYLSSVVDAPGTCEDGFRDGGIESPLAEDDDTFFGLAVIALGIAALLQGH